MSKSALRNTNYTQVEPLEEETGTFLDRLPMRIVNPIINFTCIALLISNWAFCILNYSDLPEWIPMQYGFTGGVNYSAPKIFLFILPIAAVTTFFFQNIRSFNPSKDKQYEKVLPERRDQYVMMKTIVNKFSGLFAEVVLMIASLLLVYGPSISIPQRKILVWYLLGFVGIAVALGWLLNRSLVAQVNRPSKAQ